MLWGRLEVKEVDILPHLIYTTLRVTLLLRYFTNSAMDRITIRELFKPSILIIYDVKSREQTGNGVSPTEFHV